VIDISKKDLEEIIADTGAGDPDVLFIEGFRLAGEPNVSLAFTLPYDLMPHFWLSVATWYCEREHLSCNSDSFDLPEWTPLDLATNSRLSINGDTCPIIYFPAFRLVNW
jgi:hypothetical protein